MGTGFGIGHRDIRDAFDGHGVVKGAIVAEDTAVAVGGIFAEADVGDDEEIWKGTAQETDGGNDGAGWVIGGRAEGILR